MNKEDNSCKNKKKNRIKISSVNDVTAALNIEENYIENINKDNLKEILINRFGISDLVYDELIHSIIDSEITYKVENIKELIEYIENISKFKYKHKKLSAEISKIKSLTIDRVEYEREHSDADNVEHMLEVIEAIKEKVSSRIESSEKYILKNLELEIEEKNIFTKDIELLKKIITTRENYKEEKYNNETRTKTITIEIPEKLNNKFIPACKGSVEYHYHLKSNIPRMRRLLKNMDNYIKEDEKNKGHFRINQSDILQDTINIAIAKFQDKEFKAVSGSNNLDGFCKAPEIGNEAFESYRVNKLGHLGVGYNRFADSEKKIIEEINREIVRGKLEPKGQLILYSKWEPCPSCYFVISRFCKVYPNINVQVKYEKRYGE